MLAHPVFHNIVCKQSIRLQVYLLLLLCIITYNQNIFVISKPMFGQTVELADQGEFPYVVSFARVKKEGAGYEKYHICTGILVTKQHALTAALCTEGQEPRSCRIVVGQTNLRVGKLHYISGWIKYNDWCNRIGRQIQYSYNNVVIIKLIKEVADPIQPALISSIPIENFYGLNVQIASWGAGHDNLISFLMKKVTLTVLTNTECEDKIQALHGSRIPIDERRFCTATNPAALMHIGDFGAPVIFMDTVIGIHESTAPLPNEPFNPKKVNVHSIAFYYLDFIMLATHPNFRI